MKIQNGPHQTWCFNDLFIVNKVVWNDMFSNYTQFSYVSMFGGVISRKQLVCPNFKAYLHKRISSLMKVSILPEKSRVKRWSWVGRIKTLHSDDGYKLKLVDYSARNCFFGAEVSCFTMDSGQGFGILPVHRTVPIQHREICCEQCRVALTTWNVQIPHIPSKLYNWPFKGFFFN